MRKLLIFNFLGFRDPDGTLHPPDTPPEWMKEKVRQMIINTVENRKRIHERISKYDSAE